MQFIPPLIPGRLVQRYKRFLADVRLADGSLVTATCPNTGAMLGLTTPGAAVWLSVSDKPTRKYAHTWEMIETDLGAGPVMVGINTNHPNRLVADAIRAQRLAELAGYGDLRCEVKYGQGSRVDLLLEDTHKPPCFVEIKNSHLMRQPGLAEFPDSRTERGVKHLQELAREVSEGRRAVMVYLIQRADAERFAVAGDIDPAYAAAAAEAKARGVEMLAYRCRLTPEGIDLEGRVPIVGDEPIAADRKPKKAPKGKNSSRR